MRSRFSRTACADFRSRLISNAARSAKSRIICRSRSESEQSGLVPTQQNMPYTPPSGMRIGTLIWLPIGVACVIGRAIATASFEVSAIRGGRRPSKICRQ